MRTARRWHPFGMQSFDAWIPVVSLAKPRSTTGYKLSCLRHDKSACGAIENRV